MGHAEMQKLDPSLGKSIDLNCRRKLEDPAISAALDSSG